ncbi:hypothetical protein DFH29DRAFT_1072909 [Suillus ampliporus]|nr:hypothetical protein DFH29DRAFT_1072909 [Suillus ampliporus]
MLQLAPESEVVPVLRTHSFSSLSQLLEALGSTPDLHSALGVVDKFEDDFDRERESDHLISDTLINTSLYTGPDAAYTVSVGTDTTDTINAGHPPTVELESTHTLTLTKRRQALLELLTSERAYARDLALIRDVYMRLASGYPPPYGFSNAHPVSGSEISSFSSSGSVSPISTSDTSTSGLCPPKIQLNLPSLQLSVPALTQIGPSLTLCPPLDSSNAKTPTRLSRPACELPLSVTDIRIIFRNISDLAVLSDMLVSKLEKVIEEGGKGVGEVFLELIPLIAPPYTTYVTAHPRALAHLDVLSVPPQLTSQFSRWLKESKELVEAHTHALDLPSLLIKPVQRLFKYRLLLSAVINATPEPLDVLNPQSISKAFGKPREGAEGLEQLREAKQKMVEAARAMNEQRRRVEVVREVLGSGHAKDDARATGLRSIGIRMRSLRTPRSPSKSPSKQKGSAYPAETNPDLEHAEAALVAALERKLKSHITTLSHLARDVLAYAQTLHTLFGALVKWGWAFAGVIGINVSPELSLNNPSSNPTSTPHASTPDVTGTGQSEAFDAFLALCTGLVELTQELEHELHTHILPSLQSLKGTSVAPLKLLSALHTLHPLHLHLLHLPTTRKHRPSEALLQASQSYIAVAGAACAGAARILLDLARGMEAFWGVVRERWGELWDALRVGGEGLGGDEDAGVSRDGMGHMDRPGSGGETVRVWRERWGDVLGVLGALIVVNPPKKIERLHPVNPQYYVVQQGQRHRTSPQQGAKAANVAAALGALDSQVSPTRPRQHQHQGSYDARYARESFEGRPRRDEPWPGREREYDARYSSGSGSYDTVPRLHDPRSSQSSYDYCNSQSSSSSYNPASRPSYSHYNSYDISGRRRSRSQSSYDYRTSQSSSSYNPASRPSHSRSNSYDISGRRRSGSTNNIPVGPILRKPSDESLRSGKSGKSGKSYMNSPGPGPGRGIEDVPPVPSSLQLPPQSRNGVSPPRLKPTQMKSLPMLTINSIPFGIDPPPSPSSKSKIADTLRPSHHRRLAYPMPTTPTRTHSPQTPTRRTTNLQGLRALYQCAAIHMCIPPAGVLYRGLPFLELRSGDTFDVLREYGHPSTHPDLPMYVNDGEDCLLLVREPVDGEGGKDSTGRGEVGWALASFLVPLD